MAVKKKTFAGNASRRDREELSAARARQAGIEPLTPELSKREQTPEEVKRIMEGKSTEVQEIEAEKKLGDVAVQNLVNTRLLAEDVKKEKPTTEQTTTEQTITEQTAEEPSYGQKVKEALKPYTPEGKQKGAGEAVTAMFTIATPVLKPVAQIYDFVQSFFSGGKSIEQKTAESEFADVKASINQDLNLLSQGIGDADKIRRDIKTAEIINKQFGALAKDWSTRGLRYYLTDGKDILIQTDLNEGSIENWKLQLATAEQQGRIKILRAGL